jgi:hypothetical protein
MSTLRTPISDMLVTVKAREVQRGMLAEMGGEQARAARHFLAAAHLELVLLKDYAEDGQDDMAFRSGLSAASCFWRAGQVEKARPLFDSLVDDFPDRAGAVEQSVAELEQDYPWSKQGSA